MKAAFGFAVFTETGCFRRSIVRPFSPAWSSSTLHHTSFSQQNARGRADAFMRCNTICGGCENELLVLCCEHRADTNACMRESFPPLDKLKVKHTEMSHPAQKKPQSFCLMDLQSFCPSRRIRKTETWVLFGGNCRSQRRHIIILSSMLEGTRLN